MLPEKQAPQKSKGGVHVRPQAFTFSSSQQNIQFIKEYVETPEMSAKDKIKDLNIMIDAFVEEERYEDCALLVKIKDKVKKYYKQNKNKK